MLGKLRKVLGAELDGGFDRSLEIGAGTGYFSLNLLQAGVVDEATCTDISPGMVTHARRATPQRLGLDVRTARADAESLPFADASFDLVLGHAVLHHLPDLRRAFAEFHRVLRPGGRIVFAGEPSRVGDRIAGVPKRGASALAPVWRRAAAGPAPPPPAAAIPASPTERPRARALRRHPRLRARRPGTATRAGPASPTSRVRGEELAANWFGWFNRALEATADPDDVPMLWRQYAFHGYLLLQRLDERRARAAAAAGDLLQPAAHRPAILAHRPSRHRARRLRLMPTGSTREFPLFPLGLVALPGELVPLHIFEERYKTMMNECLRGRAASSGSSGWPTTGCATIGCACEIERCSSGWRTGA